MKVGKNDFSIPYNMKVYIASIVFLIILLLSCNKSVPDKIQGGPKKRQQAGCRKQVGWWELTIFRQQM